MTSTRPPAALGVSRWPKPPPVALLALAGALYGVAQLVLVSPRMGIGWDEAVYASQYAAHAPPAVFAAPRARGVSLLVAPVVAVTDSVLALRLYLTALSSAALFGAFAVWLRVRNDRTVPLAALLFAGCWTSLFYGNEAMPNLYVALAAVAAVGFLVSAGRWAPVGLAGALAVMSLMRPSDALVIALPLAVAALAVPRRRRVASLAAIAAGTAVGAGQWLVEARSRFGGLGTRLREAGEQNATGWTVSVAEHARALDGPTLCRFGVDCGGVSPVALTWCLALAAMTGLGLWSAWRDRRVGPLALATACGLASALPYLFYVGYAAPRFLMPAYALLSLPVAEAVARLVTRRSGVAVVAVGLLAHLALQGAYAQRMADNTFEERQAMSLAVEQLRRLAVRPPCMIYGQGAAQIAYLLGCDSQAVAQRLAHRPPARIRRAVERGERVVLVHTDVRLPRYLTTWREVDLPGPWKARFGP